MEISERLSQIAQHINTQHTKTDADVNESHIHSQLFRYLLQPHVDMNTLQKNTKVFPKGGYRYLEVVNWLLLLLLLLGEALLDQHTLDALLHGILFCL